MIIRWNLVSLLFVTTCSLTVLPSLSQQFPAGSQDPMSLHLYHAGENEMPPLTPEEIAKEAEPTPEKLQAYKDDLARRIKRSWFPPAHVPSKMIVIDFRIGPNGDLVEHKLRLSGGSPVADEAAMKSIVNAIRYRPLQPAFKEITTAARFTLDAEKGPIVELSD